MLCYCACTMYVLTGLSAPPQNITVMVISSTSLTVSWDPPPLADQNGVTSYQVRISTVNSIPASSNTVNLGGTSYIAVGLDEFQEYDIEVASVTALGVGPFSTPIRTQTLEDGMCTGCVHLCVYFLCTCEHLLA